VGKSGKKGEAKAESSTARSVKKAADKFNWKVRRNIFIGLLIFTFLGAMVSVYNYVRSQDAPFGFGPATEIEVVAQELNVRSEPSSSKDKEMILGSVAKGSHHIVIEQRNKNCLLIRVTDRSTREPGGVSAH